MTTNKDRSEVIERRSEVFRLDCSGMPATEIAARLGVSVNTVSYDLAYIQREWDERGTFLDVDYDPDGATEQDQEQLTPNRKEPPRAQADGGKSRRAGGAERVDGERADTVESCAGAAAGARRPWWLPDPADGGMPEELREAIAGSILPAYQGLVLEAPSILERVAGELLVQALWAGCVQQLKYKRNYTKALSDDPFASAGVVGDPIALLGPKIKAGNFLVKVQQARQKQEEAARKREQSAFSGHRSGAGSGVGVPALAGNRVGKPPEGGTPTEEMSRSPGAFAEEPIGVGQTGFERESTHSPAAHTTTGGIEVRDDAAAEESGRADQSGPTSRGTSFGMDESRKGDPRSGRRMSRFPGAVAEECEGVDQKGSVERIAAEEKKMGEKKIPSVDENGGAQRSAEPTPNGPLRSLTPDRTKIVWG